MSKKKKRFVEHSGPREVVINVYLTKDEAAMLDVVAQQQGFNDGEEMTRKFCHDMITGAEKIIEKGYRGQKQ